MICIPHQLLLKGKAVPLQAWSSPEVSGKLRFTRKQMSDHHQMYAVSVRFTGDEDTWTYHVGNNSRFTKIRNNQLL